MFDFGISELMLIMVVALIVIGPERLPKVARTLGHLWGRAQRYVNGVKADIERQTSRLIVFVRRVSSYPAQLPYFTMLSDFTYNCQYLVSPATFCLSQLLLCMVQTCTVACSSVSLTDLSN